MSATKILLADDHEVMREGLRLLLKGQSEYEVCGVAKTGREAVDQALKLQPDIVVLDMSMPEMTGLEAARKIKRALPQTEILIFTANENEAVIRQVFDAGAKSYIQKSEAASHLLDAIRSLREHKPFFTNNVGAILFAKFVNQPDDRGGKNGSALSEREREVLRLLGEGNSNKEVAAKLGISTRTVEVHRAAIMKKLDIKSFSELIRWAIRNHVVSA